jgi:hypothetical protein
LGHNQHIPILKPKPAIILAQRFNQKPGNLIARLYIRKIRNGR